MLEAGFEIVGFAVFEWGRKSVFEDKKVGFFFVGTNHKLQICAVLALDFDVFGFDAAHARGQVSPMVIDFVGHAVANFGRAELHIGDIAERGGHFFEGGAGFGSGNGFVENSEVGDSAEKYVAVAAVGEINAGGAGFGDVVAVEVGFALGFAVEINLRRAGLLVET